MSEKLIFNQCEQVVKTSAGAKYTKHIYAGSQRIVSKIGDTESFLGDPYTSNCAGNGLLNVDYAAKYTQSVQTIRDNYAHFDEVYRGADNNDTPGSCYCNFNQSYSLLASANNFEPARENYQYFYHSDHLGSTSMTTDADGNISQRIQYLPFGEVFVEKRNTNWNTPFLFNAKELDEETGLYYYGARYYDPRTSLWLSADPLGEKYPGVSPYAYCMNNPVRLIDPDGRDVEIKGNDEFKLKVFYDLQKLTTSSLMMLKSGKVIESSNYNKKKHGEIKFFGIGDGEDKEFGTKIISNTISSKHIITIEETIGENSFGDYNSGAFSQNGKEGKGSGGTIRYNPSNKGDGVVLEDGSRNLSPGFISLAHEFLHSWHAVKGEVKSIANGFRADPDRGGSGQINHTGISGEEFVTRQQENIIRKEHGIKLRAIPQY